MKYSVSNCGQYGVITDIDQAELPPEAWSSVNNVRCQHNWIGSIGGHASISLAGSPFSGAGHYIIPLQTESNYYLVYPNDTDADYAAETIFQFDGTSHTEITRAAGDYTGVKTDRWNGCNFQNIVILNNNVDAPQYWNGVGLCQNLIWDGANDWEDYDGAAAYYRARVIRPYLNFLIAMDINDDGTRYSQMIHWSDAAEPGTTPTTWNYASTTNLSGRLNIASTPGNVLDGLTLRGSFIIYKDDSVHVCNHIGGNSVFDIDTLFIDRGLYSTDCVADIGGRHVVLGDSSLYLHDGHSYKDILSGKNAEKLFSDIEPSLYEATFLAHNRAKTEVWICYPSISATDSDQCNKALIWNYVTNAWTYRDLPDIYHALTGIVASSQSDTWDYENVLTWDAESSMTWDMQFYSPIGDTLIGISDDLYQFDYENQFAGVNASCAVERTGINLGGPDQANTVTAIYPRIEGGPVTVRVGYHTTIDSAVTWSTPQTFTPGVDRKVDVRKTGLYHALQIYSDSNVEWKVNGYDLHYEFAGRR